VDLLTAQEEAADRFDDVALLNRAGELDCVLFSHDDDLLREATRRQLTEEAFAGVIYAHQLNVTIGQCIDGLNSFCTSMKKQKPPIDAAGTV